MFSALKLCLFAFLCMISWFNSVQGHKMLVIVPMYGKSHWIYMKVFINELINRGHEVTCITNFPMAKYKLDNYTEILIDPPFLINQVGEWASAASNGDCDLTMKLFYESILEFIVKPENMFKWSLNSPLIMQTFGTYYFGISSMHGLESRNVQQLIHSENQHFDLIIVEDLMHDSFLMFGHKFKAPMVTMCK